jgi:hypothetical protein
MDINLLGPVAQHIKQHTCQLTQIGGPFGFKPRGTGVLIEAQNSFYLLTASHVIDETERLYIPSKQGMLKLAGEIVFSDLKHDKYTDTACMKLDAQGVDLLKSSYSFLPESGIGFKHTTNYNAYSIYGYPESMTKKEHDVIISRGHFWELRHAKHKVYQHYKIDSDKCIILDKSGRITSQETGRKERFKLKPNGLSGGGIWALEAHGNNPIILSYALVGIMTEYKKDKYDIIIGNKIQLFSELITILNSLEE